jgi:hypothetical protein
MINNTSSVPKPNNLMDNLFQAIINIIFDLFLTIFIKI